MIPTRDDFARASTTPMGSGWVNEQLEVMGVNRKACSGWVQSLVGTEIPDERWEAFVRAGDKRRSKVYAQKGIRLEDGPTLWFGYQHKEHKCGSPFPSIQEKPNLQLQMNENFTFIHPSVRDAFFKSDSWLHIRAVVLRLGRYQCKHCGAGSKSKLHVDHIIPITVDWSKRLDLTNLQILCEACNMGKSNLFSE